MTARSADPSAVDVPEELAGEIRDALAHFYDSAHLMQHPLMRRFPSVAGSDAAAAVPSLRRMLLGAIEGLRPPSSTPADDPAWRPYTVLHQRYIVGKGTEEVERELALSRRQRQREQQRAIEAVAISLWTSRAGRETVAAPSRGNTRDVLWQEISRTAGEEAAYDAADELQVALNSVRALAERHGVALEGRAAGHMAVRGSEQLFRQLLIALLSHTIRTEAATRLQVRLRMAGEAMVVELVGQTDPPAGNAVRPEPLPETVAALARAQSATISLADADAGWRLTVRLPLTPGERTVIIVEDNQDVVALFGRYLTGRGYRLVPVEPGEGALERIAEETPDVLILDVMMRHVGGWEILQRLKANPRLRHTPVIICSVLDEPELAASLGADASLRKPVRQAQLLECLARVLST